MRGPHYFDYLPESLIEELISLDRSFGDLEVECDNAIGEAENKQDAVDEMNTAWKAMADEVDQLADTLALALSFDYTDRIMDFLRKDFPDLAERIREHADGGFSNW